MLILKLCKSCQSDAYLYVLDSESNILSLTRCSEYTITHSDTLDNLKLYMGNDLR